MVSVPLLMSDSYLIPSEHVQEDCEKTEPAAILESHHGAADSGLEGGQVNWRPQVRSSPLLLADFPWGVSGS